MQNTSTQAFLARPFHIAIFKIHDMFLNHIIQKNHEGKHIAE